MIVIAFTIGFGKNKLKSDHKGRDVATADRKECRCRIVSIETGTVEYCITGNTLICTNYPSSIYIDLYDCTKRNKIKVKTIYHKTN